MTDLLELVLGPMMAGKSKELARRLGVVAKSGARVAYINSTRDQRPDLVSDRSNPVFSCHDPECKLSESVRGFKTAELAEFDPTGFQLIGIDEGQFFDDLVPKVRQWVLKERIPVIVAALGGSFELQNIGHTHELLCLRPAITWVSAICLNCVNVKQRPIPQARADHTILRDKKSISQLSSSGFLVGGADKYQPACLECYLEFNPGTV